MQRDNLVKIYQAFGQAAERDYQNAVGMPGAFYTEAKLCALEQDHLFAYDWICIGREEDVPEKGSYLTVTVADEPILISGETTVCCVRYPTSVDTGARRSCLDKDRRKRCAALTTVGPTTCKGG